MPFAFYTGNVPWVTTEQMIEVDRIMIEDLQIGLVQMMENAGRNLAHLARDRFLGGDPRSKEVVVLAGSGGNGGGAMVCARRLHTWGAGVRVFLSKPAGSFSPVSAHQLEILRLIDVPVFPAEALEGEEPPTLIIDGIIGYNLKGSPGGKACDLILWANAQGTPILSLDAPSGVDTTSGTVFDPAIQAVATMTLALPKEGLRSPGVTTYVGELYLADIGVPPSLYFAPGLAFQVECLFAEDDIIRLR